MIVGEPANGIEREHLALHEHAESRSRKSLLRNRLRENRVGRSELKALRGSGRWQ